MRKKKNPGELGLGRVEGEEMIGSGKGMGEELGGVGERVANHGGFESKIALVSLERKGTD